MTVEGLSRPLGMARNGTKPLTPASTRKLWEVYLQCGSYSETGRLTGHPESTVRCAIKRHQTDLAGRREAHALALEEGEMAARELVGAARTKLGSALKTATTENLPELVRAVHDSARVASTLRLNDAKLRGVLVEKTQVTVTASPLTIYSPDEQEPE